MFYRVTKEIERDTMKIYEIRRNCTRHDVSIRDSMKLYETRQLHRVDDTRFSKSDSISKRDSIKKRDSKGQSHSISKRDWNNKQESISKRGILEQKSSNYET